MGSASLRGVQMCGAKINDANLDGADLTGVDLTGSSWFDVNVSRAELTDVRTTGARAGGVNWSQAEVPPAEIPEPIPARPWIPALLAGIGLVFAATIILASRRRRA